MKWTAHKVIEEWTANIWDEEHSEVPDGEHFYATVRIPFDQCRVPACNLGWLECMPHIGNKGTLDVDFIATFNFNALESRLGMGTIVTFGYMSLRISGVIIGLLPDEDDLNTIRVRVRVSDIQVEMMK